MKEGLIPTYRSLCHSVACTIEQLAQIHFFHVLCPILSYMQAELKPADLLGKKVKKNIHKTRLETKLKYDYKDTDRYVQDVITRKLT